MGAYVMDDYRRALLGDREAAKRLTDAGGAGAVSVLRGRRRRCRIRPKITAPLSESCL